MSGTNLYAQSDINPLIWVKTTNENGYADDCELRGSTSLPTDTGLFSQGCTLKIESNGAEYINTAADGLTPTWVNGIPAGSINAAALASGSVTLAKLASGIAPSHVVKFAGTFTTAGGDANESITVTGALATDIVAVTVRVAGATPRSIVSAVPATDAINVVMSGDPSTDHVLQYVVFRAAA